MPSETRPKAGAGVAGLGDGAAALGLARTVLAGHEAARGLELMRVAAAPDVVDGGDEGGGGDAAHAGDGAQARHPRILDGEVLDPLVAVREWLVEGPHDGEERRDDRAQLAGQGQVLNTLHGEKWWDSPIAEWSYQVPLRVLEGATRLDALPPQD